MGEATISVIIFVIVMIVIITEKINRAVVAVGGAVLLFITGVLTVDSGAEYIDYNTIGVLVGMMLFVSVVKNSGLFEYMAIKAAKVAKSSPAKMMVIFVIITAVLSCMLDNVTTVLLIGPMTFAITRELEINPVPYIITQILASNIGGTATLIGDPPNIMIGSAAGLTFMDFIANNGIIIAVVLAVTILCFLFIFRKDFSVSSHHISRVMAMDERELIKDRALLHKSVVMIVLVALGFIFHGNLGVDSSVIALAAAIIMMIIGRQPAEDTILDVEWTTIIFFVALFVVVGGMVETGVIDRLANIIVDVTGGEMVMAMLIILWVSALLSSTLDNIPFVATMVPLIASMGESGMDVMPLWWALSLGACLGGNGTIIGASANVVLTGISAKNGHPISYMQFLKVGFPMMIISIILCTGYLLLKYA